jgi:hypothetical protein
MIARLLGSCALILVACALGACFQSLDGSLIQPFPDATGVDTRPRDATPQPDAGSDVPAAHDLAPADQTPGDIQADGAPADLQPDHGANSDFIDTDGNA